MALANFADDYLPRLFTELRTQGVAEGAIDRLRKHFETLPTTIRYLPCPYCYLEGLSGGHLISAFTRSGSEQLICAKCTVMIRL